MALTSRDPWEVIQAVRATAHSRAATNDDFVSPAGTHALALELDAPGVVHPAHLPWLAECLDLPMERLRQVLGSPEEIDLLTTLAERLEHVTTPPRLAALGVQPRELMVRRLPVPAATARPNRVPPAGGPPTLSIENAHWQNVLRTNEALATLRRLSAPTIIIESRSLEVQRSLLRLLSVLRGDGPLFEPEHTLNTTPPTPSELVVLPRGRTGFVREPMRAHEVRLSGDVALVRFQEALVQLDLTTGDFTARQFAGASCVHIDEHEAAFCDGARLSVLDLETRQFVLDPRSMPARVPLGACCGLEVLDTRSRTTALLPGPSASSGFSFATSPCGSFVWLDILPEHDDLGVYSLEHMDRAYQVWPHASLGTPRTEERSSEGHDETARALVRWGEGFRFTYGRHVLDGSRAFELERVPHAACFDRSGTHLATVDDEYLTLHALAADGPPQRSSRWSLAPLRAHLTLDELDLNGLECDPETLLATVGTVGELSVCTVDVLRAQLYTEESDERLQRLIDEARAKHLPSTLTRG